MSRLRTVAWAFSLWLALPSSVWADTLTSGGGWTFFYDPNNALPSSLLSIPSLVSTGTADATINFGANGQYPETAALTTGTPQPWYLSPAVSQAFGHSPTASDQASFESLVLSDVKTTFALAGMNPNVTIDPTVPTNHTISVVSGLSYAPNSNAIGITDVGHDGFGFIDKLNFATNRTDLAWAVAHNVSHELMHAFGVGIHPDTTGSYIDAASATWDLLKNPNATFSPAAVPLITATKFGSISNLGGLSKEVLIDGAQEIMTVPEPSTFAGWSVVAAALLVDRRRRTSILTAA